MTFNAYIEMEMHYDLTISGHAFRELIRGFTSSAQSRAICPVGIAASRDKTVLLVHRVRWHRRPDDFEPSVTIRGCSDLAEFDRFRSENRDFSLGRLTRAALAIGIGDAAGQITGFRRAQEEAKTLDGIQIIDGGLPAIDLTERRNAKRPPTLEDFPSEELWSRSIGALGEDTWRQITSLHYAVVGCGRTGSLMASALSRLGVERLTLIDPDILESHNVGEMDAVSRNDVGMPKVDAIATSLARGASKATTCLYPLREPIFSLPALLAVKSADVLVSCVDNSAARLATDFLAKLYLKPLIDVGTGVLSADVMGADVRLILPGRCLLCFGGVAQLERARGDLRRQFGEEPPMNSGNWRTQRAGSLRSLNQIATGIALRLIEELLRGRVARSSWLSLNVGSDGIPALRQIEHMSNEGCAVCSITGQGDASLNRLPALIESIESTSR